MSPKGKPTFRSPNVSNQTINQRLSSSHGATTCVVGDLLPSERGMQKRRPGAIKQRRENLWVQRAVDLIVRLHNFHAYCDHNRDIEKLRRRITMRDLVADLIPALKFRR